VIEPEHESPFVSNPNVATFYNRAQTYGRHAIGDHGDHSDWFGFDRELLRDALRGRQPDVEQEPARLFPISHCTVDARTYFLQRQLFEIVRTKTELDAFEVEEQVVLLLARVLERALEPDVSHTGGTLKQHRDLASAAELLLSRRFDEPLSLNAIADQVGASVFHLCRTFRRVTGATLHQYRTSLRLRASLERISESAETLTDVAVSLGFASHSHFTRAFRLEFHVRPSTFRSAWRAVPER
jgi:AraC-like DNA-binding protein